MSLDDVRKRFQYLFLNHKPSNETREFIFDDVINYDNFSNGAAYSGREIRKLMQRIRDFYGELGFALIYVGWEFIAKTSQIEIIIIEGKIQRIGSIQITGTKKLDTRVVQRDITLQVGEVVNTKRINEINRSLVESGHYSYVSVDYKEGRNNFGILMVQVKEANKHWIKFGMGYSFTNGLMGDFQYINNNWAGSGKDFGIYGMKTAEITRLQAVFRQRHLFESNFNGTLQGGLTDVQEVGYNNMTIGAKALLETKIVKHLTAGVGIRLDFVKIDHVQDSMIQEVQDAKDDHIYSSGFIGTLVYDTVTKDKRGNPIDGIRARGALYPSYAEKKVFLKAVGTVLAYLTVHENQDGQKHVATGRITLGYASNNTPFFEKLSAGGYSTIRGYRRDRIKAENRLGGKFLASTGAYYAIPLFGKNIKGIVFTEVASVGNTPAALKDEVRVNFGVGLQLYLNQNPVMNKIEGGFIFPVLKQEGDKIKPFYIMFGNYDPTYDL